MKFRLVKLGRLSGKKASIYSVIIDGDDKTLFDYFLIENQTQYKTEIKDILTRLNTIAFVTGADEHFFKPNEGYPGDGVEALYDQPDSNLRLYCIRYGRTTIILGGGGYKPKSIRALQEDPKLKEENYLLRSVSALIRQAFDARDVSWSNDYMDFNGDLTFQDNDNEDYED